MYCTSQNIVWWRILKIDNKGNLKEATCRPRQECSTWWRRLDDHVRSSSRGRRGLVCTAERRPRTVLEMHIEWRGCARFVTSLGSRNHRTQPEPLCQAVMMATTLVYGSTNNHKFAIYAFTHDFNNDEIRSMFETCKTKNLEVLFLDKLGTIAAPSWVLKNLRYPVSVYLPASAVRQEMLKNIKQQTTMSC